MYITYDDKTSNISTCEMDDDEWTKYVNNSPNKLIYVYLEEHFPDMNMHDVMNIIKTNTSDDDQFKRYVNKLLCDKCYIKISAT